MLKSDCAKELHPARKQHTTCGCPAARHGWEKLEEENKLLRAKTEALQAAKNTEEMYAEAIKAMGIYSGKDEEDNSNDWA